MIVVWLLTGGEMRERDRWAVEEVGLPKMVLMENAGRQVAALAQHILGPSRGKKVWIFAGRGNNGGDGLVAARYLLKAGVAVEVFLLNPGEGMGAAAAKNLKICRRLGLPLLEINAGGQLAGLMDRRNEVNLMLDAILGTGLSGPAKGLEAEAISFLNGCGRPILAVDVPSGLVADTGACPGPLVRAQDTITLDLPKIGLCLYPGAEYVGRLWVAEIGMPPGAPLPEPGIFLTTPERLAPLLSPRPRVSHKGTYGRVLVVAGSQGMTGAAVLAGRGALRGGAGLVTLAVPAGIQPIVASQIVEGMSHPLGQATATCLGWGAKGDLLRLLAEAHVLALGPGLGRGEDTAALVRSLLPQVTVPLVLDADGLAAIRGRVEILTKIPGPVVITPHLGEMAGLCGLTVEAVQAQPLELARQKAAEWGVILVLKGARTIIAAPNGATALNPTGNPGLASGGTGDVLTGLLAGLIGQGFSPFWAAVGGTFLHGMAGDLAAAEKGEMGMLAGDVVEYLPTAQRALGRGEFALPFPKILSCGNH